MPAARVAQPARTTITWITADEEVETTGWEEMAKKLKAPAGKKKASEASHKLRVLNRLGADGWEVIAHRPSESFSGAEVWLFKRKVK
jgi:hypothetical protein